MNEYSSPDVSIVLCTYNRCQMLREALANVLHQQADGVTYEVIVVDNNSTDATRKTVEDLIDAGADNLRYVFESRQGKSFALMTGIEQVAAPLVALTDDDLIVDRAWVANIKRVFDTHPEIGYAGGKVLPLWRNGQPPTWLTQAHWGALALTDYGDTEFYVDANNPICLVGANLIIRREVFDTVGMFATEFQRVGDGIGSTEDHEWQLRVWRAGLRGLYAPQLVISADVQANRYEKSYHRRWHTGHGKYCAMMHLYEITDENGRLRSELPQDAVTLFGTPAYVYRNILASSLKWGKSVLAGDESMALNYENNVRSLLSYIRQRRRMSEATDSPLVQVARFISNLAGKKLKGA